MDTPHYRPSENLPISPEAVQPAVRGYVAEAITDMAFTRPTPETPPPQTATETPDFTAPPARGRQPRTPAAAATPAPAAAPLPQPGESETPGSGHAPVPAPDQSAPKAANSEKHTSSNGKHDTAPQPFDMQEFKENPPTTEESAEVFTDLGAVVKTIHEKYENFVDTHTTSTGVHCSVILETTVPDGTVRFDVRMPDAPSEQAPGQNNPPFDYRVYAKAEPVEGGQTHHQYYGEQHIMGVRRHDMTPSSETGQRDSMVGVQQKERLAELLQTAGPKVVSGLELHNAALELGSNGKAQSEQAARDAAPDFNRYVRQHMAREGTGPKIVQDHEDGTVMHVEVNEGPDVFGEVTPYVRVRTVGGPKSKFVNEKTRLAYPGDNLFTTDSNYRVVDGAFTVSSNDYVKIPGYTPPRPIVARDGGLQWADGFVARQVRNALHNLTIY